MPRHDGVVAHLIGSGPMLELHLAIDRRGIPGLGCRGVDCRDDEERDKGPNGSGQQALPPCFEEIGLGETLPKYEHCGEERGEQGVVGPHERHHQQSADQKGDNDCRVPSR